MKYLEKTQVMVNQGGIPTTLEHSGEQWDYPNAWPPLQYIMIKGLDQTGDSWAQDLAFEITEKWVRSNYKAFNETHTMYEKVIIVDRQLRSRLKCQNVSVDKKNLSAPNIVSLH